MEKPKKDKKLIKENYTGPIEPYDSLTVDNLKILHEWMINNKILKINFGTYCWDNQERLETEQEAIERYNKETVLYDKYIEKSKKDIKDKILNLNKKLKKLEK